MRDIFSTRRFLVVAYTLASALAANQTYELTLTNEFIQPDGYNRSSVLANRRFPGPLISAFKNDQLQVKVINRLTNTTMARGTSIHWHGLFQNKTAEQDGVAWITQCPISPGEDFQYDFNVGEQAGTYWYHSHVTTQYCDGLRGPLVVYDKEDPHSLMYDVDDESTVITLGDWLHLPSPQGWRDFENPQSTVINGLGRLPNSTKTPLAVVDVDFGVRYRFRIINTACISSFNFSIDNHKLTVIEADGVETHPVTVDILPIYAGQRYSVVVQADQKPDNYWIRAVPEFVGVQLSNKTGVDAAILRYNGSEEVEPRTLQNGTVSLLEQDLVPWVESDPASREPDISINLEIGHAGHDFTINNRTFKPPSIPVLLQILNGTLDPLEVMPNGSVIVVPRNKLISVSIPGGLVNAPHPFHLHGHTFEVIRSAGTNVTNLKNPPIRDVVNTGLRGDNVTIHFRTDNPGPWIFHCHIDYHLEAGLAVVFAEDPEGQRSGPSAIDTPSDWEALCPKWYSLKNGTQYSVNDDLVQPE